MNMQPYRPTHTVGQGGVAAWTTPDANQPSVARLDERLEVQVVQFWGEWANVQCSNGWTAWVDGRQLHAIAPGAPAYAAAPGYAAAPASRAGTSPAASYALPVGLASAGLVLLGVFLPWFTVTGFDANAFKVPVDFLWSTEATIEVDAGVGTVGGLLLAVAIAIGALALTNQPSMRRIAGGVGAVVCVLYAIQLGRQISDTPGAPGLFSVLGFGMYVALVGAVLALVVGGSSRAQ